MNIMRLKKPIIIVLIVFYIEQVHCQCMITNVTLSCAEISDLPRDIAAVRGNLQSVRTIYIAAKPPGNYKQTMEVSVDSFRLFPNLKRLRIINYSIGRPFSNTFSNSSIEIISLNFDDIDRILPGTFMNLPEVKKINLDNNRLKVIPKGIIGYLPKLTDLVLSNNEITFIEISALDKLPNLRKLHLEKNNIDSIAVHQIISHPEQLEILWLHNNLLSMLNNTTLRNLTNLKVLNLGFNRISVIEPNTFEHTPHLQTLVLTHNSLKIVDGDVFPRSGMNSLDNLYLDHNHLMFLSSKFFFRMNGLKRITLVGNPWFCPCLYIIERILHENSIQQKCQGAYVTGERPFCVVEDGASNNNCNYKYNDMLSEKYRNYLDANPIHVRPVQCIL